MKTVAALILGVPTLLVIAPPSAGHEPAAAGQSRDAGAVVRPGIETFLSDLPARVRGQRIGLITNQSGIDRSGTSDIDLIARHKDLKRPRRSAKRASHICCTAESYDPARDERWSVT